MNNLLLGIKRVKVLGHLSCVFIMMTAGCIHQISKNDALNESSQKDLSEQEITDGTATWNVEFSGIYPQFSLQSINKLERFFCEEITWDLYISEIFYSSGVGAKTETSADCFRNT